ncbi:MAG: corrinoid protein [archaeon]|nr:corrinoid protein [archaeon]MCP8314552.1 corrinoid protein [archaeon]MCP8316904.1 corrinoid protein [archaeon]MCP8320933.1 corrinoid protein [archaeon]
MLEREEILKRLSESVIRGDAEEAKKAAKDAIEAGIDAYEAIMLGCGKGMSIVSDKYERFEYFMPDIVCSAEAMSAATDILKPHISVEKVRLYGRVIIGTVEGDIHSIGKEIVKVSLAAAGFDVHDLGVNVPNDEFLKKAMEIKPKIVAMSTLTTPTIESMANVIKLFQREGVREEYRFLVGGAVLSEEWCIRLGADGYGKDASEGVRVAKRLMEEARM